MENKKTNLVHDLFTEFEFEEFPLPTTISNEIKLVYIKEMISFTKNDKQGIFMYFAFALAALVFLFDKIDAFQLNPDHVYIAIFFSGILCLALSAVFFFTYWRKIHKCQSNIISCIPSLNIIRVRDLWIDLWNRNKRYFKFGLFLLTSGIVILFTELLISKVIF